MTIRAYIDNGDRVWFYTTSRHAMFLVLSALIDRLSPIKVEIYDYNDKLTDRFFIHSTDDLFLIYDPAEV